MQKITELRKKLNSLNPFENQVYFYLTPVQYNLVVRLIKVLIPLRIRSISTYRGDKGIPTGRLGLNPFENQVYFYRCPPEAAPGAGLRACLREPRRCEPVLSETKIVISGILLKFKGICSARPFYERLLNV